MNQCYTLKLTLSCLFFPRGEGWGDARGEGRGEGRGHPRAGPVLFSAALKTRRARTPRGEGRGLIIRE